MNKSITLGPHTLRFYNLNDKYDEPEIVFQKESFFKTKEYKLEDYQIIGLINYVTAYLKSTISFKDAVKNELKDKLIELEKQEKIIQKQITEANSKSSQ